MPSTTAGTKRTIRSRGIDRAQRNNRWLAETRFYHLIRGCAFGAPHSTRWSCFATAAHPSTKIRSSEKGHLMMSQDPVNPVPGDLGMKKAARVSPSGTRIYLFSSALQPYPGTHLFFFRHPVAMQCLIGFFSSCRGMNRSVIFTPY